MPTLPSSFMALERYRQLLGASVSQFYNLSFDGCGFYSGSTVGCSDDWSYYSYGNVLNFFDLTTAINQSVIEIERFLGHYIRPSFVCSDQIYPINLPYPPLNLWPSFPVSSDFQQVGKRTEAVVGTATQTGGTLTFEDRNGDGFKEIGVITLTATTVTAENCWLNVFTDSGYKIDPITVTTNAPNSVIIEFDSYLVINNGLYNPLDPNIAPLDACNLADNVLFLESLTVKEIYPDPLQAARFKLYDNPLLSSCGDCGSDECEICTATYQTACLQTTGIDNRLRPIPADWNATTEQWCQVGVCDPMCRPTSVELNYFSNPCQSGCDTASCSAICPEYERAVFYLTNARLGDVCDCGCEGGNIRKYQREVAGERGPNTYDNAGLSFSLIDNAPFGTRYGEVQAYVLLKQSQDRNLTSVLF